MDALQIDQMRDCLQAFAFEKLFIEELGWSYPDNNQPMLLSIDGQSYQANEVAQFSGAIVFLIIGLPKFAHRSAIHTQLSQRVHENLLIFVDSLQNPTQSLWLWRRRDQRQYIPREHLYVKGQSGDLFLSKLSIMKVDYDELNEFGEFPLAELLERMTTALDIEKVTKNFFKKFEQQHIAFVQLIGGIYDARERRWLASVLMNRLMFIWFLQRKLFLDGGRVNYLPDKLAASQQRGADLFYSEFLQALFFEGFAKPAEQRSVKARALIGEIVFLNGGLFLPHQLELKYGTSIIIPDQAFSNLFALFGRYSWHLDDTPGGRDDEINPDVLGYIFEKYINQKAFGAYYTRPEITSYLCERTIHRLILARVNTPEGSPLPIAAQRHFQHFGELLFNLDADLCWHLLFEVLPNLKLLDPACGSGAFLIAAMKTLINVYLAVIGRIPLLKNNAQLKGKITEWESKHPSVVYFIKRQVITNNLFGVDVMEEATEIAKLRLFLALVAAAQSVNELEPLPNIDFNIVAGNSLIGLLRVDAKAYAEQQHKSGMADLFAQGEYARVVAEKNRLIQLYRETVAWSGAVDLSDTKHAIEKQRAAAQLVLNDLLLQEMDQAGVKFEQVTWDAAKNKAGKSIKRQLKAADIAALQPFHWGFEFDQVLNERSGFDAIITNPPWEVFQTDEKEFFQQYDTAIQKNKLRLEDWKKQFAAFMTDETIRTAWLDYASQFPFVSKWFKTAPQYAHQTSGKINLYLLFVEQCFNLLRNNGECGIVIPSGIYTDLGAKGLRDLLFDQCQMTGLFCFENRKEIFENVDSRFKFVVLTFEKGGNTETFPAAFMRHDVNELAAFPTATSLPLSVELIRQLSPNSHSIMEFKSAIDVQIAEKMLQFPLLGETIDGKWNVRLTSEFNMTTDHHLFKTAAGAGRLPLFEGKMIHQFTHQWAKPKYWLDEDEARADLFGRREDNGEQLAYQHYRLGFRDIARNTDERTMIMTVLPPMVFCNHKLPTVRFVHGDHSSMLFVCAMMNSFVIDYLLRLKVTTNLTFFMVYPTPIPRLTAADPVFHSIVSRAAQLICTTPEYDELAKAVGLTLPVAGAIDRAQLRAELDGRIARLYGLTEKEFAHILATFPLVAEEIRAAALGAYRAIENGANM